MSRWFVRPHIQEDAAFRLFCLPHAGVGASAFRGWPRQCGPEFDVVLIEPPGRESRLREPAIPTVRGLAAALAAEVAPLTDRPYALFGHSLGGVVGFELVRALAGRGQPEPVRLFVSASKPPQVAPSNPPVRHLGALDLLREIDRRYGATVPRLVMESEELRAIFVPPLRADIGALETYEHLPGTVLECPISAFAGSADAMVPPAIVEQWRACTAGPFTFRVLDGPHLYLQQAQAELIAAIRLDLLGGAPPGGAATARACTAPVS